MCNKFLLHEYRVLSSAKLYICDFSIKKNISLMKILNSTPCLSTPAESTPESSSVKLCSVKSFPGEKRLDFSLPRQYCITYLPREKYRIIDSPQWIFGFHPMSFDITPVILLVLLGVWQYLTGITAMRGNSSSRILG